MTVSNRETALNFIGGYILANIDDIRDFLFEGAERWIPDEDFDYDDVMGDVQDEIYNIEMAANELVNENPV